LCAPFPIGRANSSRWRGTFANAPALNRRHACSARFRARLGCPQISLADVEAAAAQGISLIINNRPEGESDDQTPGDSIAQAAAAAGPAMSPSPSPTPVSARRRSRPWSMRSRAMARSGLLPLGHPLDAALVAGSGQPWRGSERSHRAGRRRWL
jgi:hypothetical protein